MKIILILFSLCSTAFAQEDEKICIDGLTYRQIKCEKIVYFEKVSAPTEEELKAVEKMYPSPDSIKIVTTETSILNKTTGSK